MLEVTIVIIRSHINVSSMRGFWTKFVNLQICASVVELTERDREVMGPSVE
jgi:hypothetical protein